MKYEYVTAAKLNKSLKKKDQSEFENQIRLMALGIKPPFGYSTEDNKEAIMETAVQEVLQASKSYEDDGNSIFIHFANILQKSITKNSSKKTETSTKASKWFN